ncbi:MAG: DUF4340 domain-containing protein [Phycisphaerae bacterium]|nr:DUF4340 domain-containing protein [Phycisphaerae bacterium]
MTNRRSSAPWRSAIVAWCAAIALGGALAGMRLAGSRDSAIDAAGEPTSSSEGRRGPRPVFAGSRAIPVDRVDRIALSRHGATLEFAKRADGWMQTRPFEQPADGAQIREMLVRLADLRFVREAAADSATLAGLGLEPASAALTVGFGDETVTLRIGRRGVGGRGWARVDMGPALAVDPAIHESILEADPRRWRSWRLFDRVGAGTQRVVVVRSPISADRPAQRIEIVRDGGRWRLVSPVATRADSRAVDALLAALARAEHSGFVDDAPKDDALYGLEHAIASVETVGADASSERVEIGAGLVKGGALCARRSDRPSIVLLDPMALAALLPPAEALIDARACEIDPTDARTLRVLEPDGRLRLTLSRSLDGWTLELPGGESTPARADVVSSLLERLVSARAQALAIQPMPEELRVADIEIVPSVGGPVTVRVARERNEGNWALDESDDVLRVFPPGFDPPLDAARFRSR